MTASMDFELIANAIGYQVNKANSALRESFQKAIREAGYTLTPEQWGTLNYLTFNPGVTITELSRVTYRDKTSVTRLVDGMVKRALILRETDPSDRRIFRLYPTKKGKETHEGLVPLTKAFNLMLLKILPQREAEQLVESLKKITEALSGDV
jgi:DNA-binding MarR family transcriptional regulator